MQRFKENDATELKVINTTLPILDVLSTDLNNFYTGAWTCFKLGEVLYDLNRDPMVGVITRDTYRTSFFAIHQLFTKPGTFEFYLEVFRAIWGSDVVVEFVVPDPGKLQINVQALDISLQDFLARKIVSGAYVFEEVVDHDGDNIAFQETQGIKNQTEMDALINEISPDGIFVTITLEIED